MVLALSSLYLSTEQKAYENEVNLSTKIRSTASTHTKGMHTSCNSVLLVSLIKGI